METFIIISLVIYLIYREVKYRNIKEQYKNLKQNIPGLKKQLEDMIIQFEILKKSVNNNNNIIELEIENNSIIFNEKADFEDKILELTMTSRSIDQYFFYIKGDTSNYALSLNYSKKSKGTKIICSCRGYHRGYICKHIIWLFKNEEKIIYGKEHLKILNTFYEKEALLPTLNKLENIRNKREEAWKKDGKKLYEYFNTEEQENLNNEVCQLIGHKSGVYRSLRN
jgi:hypothetical protein